MVGYGGTILKTTDGGQTWITQVSGTSNELRSVFFTDVNTGYAVGGLITEYGCCSIQGYGGTILKTTDGGLHWIPQSGAEKSLLYSVYFTDDSTGYAVGTGGTILTTTTGGTNPASKLMIDDNISIYPNPVSDKLFITSNQLYKSALSIEIYSVKGELISKEYLDAGSILYQINLTELKSGPYLLRLITDSGKYDKKIIIKK